MKKIEGILYSSGVTVSVMTENGVIREIKEISPGTKKEEGSLYLAPAFFDNQINGYIGTEFSDPELTTDTMLKIVRALQQQGVTTFLPTVITASQESLLRSFRNLSASLENDEVAYAVPGFHLEGPYISPEDGYRGAHSREYVRRPDWDEFCRLNDAAGGKILQVTLAPEVRGAVPFIRKCVEEGIVVALGHHNGSAEEIQKAVEAGARTVTHLGNGMANNIHRFHNPLWTQLADDRLMCSLILDGFHLQPSMVKVFYRTKGSERIILTSDMTMLAGMPPGKYIWDGKEVRLTEDGIILLEKENCFAGASLPIHTGVGNMKKFTGCSLQEAVEMATKNPAGLYGLSDRGAILPGMRADMVLFSVEESRLRIRQVFVAGEAIDTEI
jgi:N-acetylglucosamine-6-phosphate deacetylase